MKRRVISILAGIVSIVCLVLSGCGNGADNDNGNGENPSALTQYTVTFNSMGGSAVASQKVYEGNPVRRPETPAYDGHYLTGWFREGMTTAWNFDTDRVTQDITLYAAWQAEENLPEYTESLVFVRDGDAYTVTGVGEDTVIVIPSEYQGLPVTKIIVASGSRGFARKGITSVTIPDSVTEIGRNTFHNCSQLQTVRIGENSELRSIGNNAFSGNSSLKEFYIPKAMTELGDSVFNNCGSLERITVAENNTVYRSENGHLIERATQTLIRGVNNGIVPDGVKVIAQAAFRRASGISKLYIPNSVEVIGNYFIADSAIAEIDYAGTQAEWDAIQKSETMWNYGNRDVRLVCEAAVEPPPERPDLPDTPTDIGDRILIAYFTYSGNTRDMAEYIEKYTGGDVVEIIAQVPYTAGDINYNDYNSRYQTERRADARPEISSTTYDGIDISDYGTVFIGYPMWNGEEPMIIRTFIEHYGELKDRNVYTFSSSGSSSPAAMNAAMKARYDETNIAGNLHVTAGALTQAETRIRAWTEEIGLSKTEESIMYIKVNGHTLTAVLAENSSAKALVELLKIGDISIETSDYGNMEKVGPLPQSLPRNDERITTEAGDLILYQGNAFVIYYAPNTYNLTRLGKINGVSASELKNILGSGNVRITLSLA